MSEAQKYRMAFTRPEWEEVCALGFDDFHPEHGKPMTRAGWVAVGHMLLGKAERIERGLYGGGPDEDMDMDECLAWANQLRGIADKVFYKFKPEDGQV